MSERQEPNGCVYAGCMLLSFPIVGIALVAAFIGVEVVIQRLVLLIPEQIVAALLGFLFLAFGGWGLFALATGRSAPGTTRSARLLALIVCIGLVLLSLPILAFALAPSDPAPGF